MRLLYAIAWEKVITNWVEDFGAGNHRLKARVDVWV
jgi:hypothetical protein